MKKLLLLFVVLLYTQNSLAQNSNSLNEIQNKTYNNEDVQVRAEFPKGEKKFNEFVMTNLKAPFNQNIKGEISVSFIVEMDGSISNIEIITDVPKDKRQEIRRVLAISPKWLPAEQEGYYVKAKVKFSLNL